MLRQFPAVAGTALLLVLTGCGSGTDDPVINVKANDPEMLAAQAVARARVDEFIAAFQNPTPDQSRFAVKVKFEDGDQVEYMWVTDLDYADGNFTGTINNDPQLVSHVQFGDAHTVAATDINDWMYMEGGEMVGGFTVAVLERRMRGK